MELIKVLEEHQDCYALFVRLLKKDDEFIQLKSAKVPDII